MIIGLMGKMGSGKDTVAAMIAPRHLVHIDGRDLDLVMLMQGPEREQNALVRGPGAVQIAQADPLKVICRTVFDFSLEQLWGPSQMRNAADERYPREHIPGPMPDPEPRCRRCLKHLDGGVCSYLTPREALQKLGTEWGRAMYENVWVDKALRYANTLQKSRVQQVDLVVISDVRFKNEVQAIRAAGGQIWKIVRSGLVRGSHASETEQDDVDAASIDKVIENNDTIDALRARVRKML